ncbi:hypothetical protein ACVIKO_005505 [Rhizobium ruizarguesonis]
MLPRSTTSLLHGLLSRRMPACAKMLSQAGPFLLSFSTAAQAGTQVFGIGQMALHLGASNSILHSVHILGSTTNLSVLKLIAPEGHSNSHAPHWVHCEAMILKAMIQLLWFSQSVCQVAAAKASS